MSSIVLFACDTVDSDGDSQGFISVVGVWRTLDGDAFSYLTLFSDNSFLYAENDLNVQSNEENGLEVGTYTSDADEDSISFSIIYDDNDPDNDSGVGDIGTPVVIDALLSNSNNTLTIAGLALTKVSVLQ